ncbi:MAG TPA: hypothetical protein GXX15_06305 [Clostridia bacterium]|nr:hypothetical protein [Clostridia bacterium]
MTNINCTANCIYQKEGKCNLSNVFSMIKKDEFFVSTTPEEKAEINCAYYIPSKKVTKK